MIMGGRGHSRCNCWLSHRNRTCTVTAKKTLLLLMNPSITFHGPPLSAPGRNSHEEINQILERANRTPCVVNASGQINLQKLGASMIIALAERGIRRRRKGMNQNLFRHRRLYLALHHGGRHNRSRGAVVHIHIPQMGHVLVVLRNEIPRDAGNNGRYVGIHPRHLDQKIPPLGRDRRRITLRHGLVQARQPEPQRVDGIAHEPCVRAD
mmetsp:Transcript_39706/g.83478  ORF Transcript_39706/g.83478 Transcript_39706/m.83478 type:complete len:209 (+) Transcript_39706:458-1084(+)